MALVMPDGNPQPMQQSTMQQQQQGSPWDKYNSSVQQGYQTYLGRGASEDELRIHHNNNAQGYNDPNQLNTALDNIRNSPEAMERQRNQQAPPTNNQPPPPGNTQQYAPPGSGGGGQAVPGVPQNYASQAAQQSMKAAPTIQSQYQPQQIRDFTGQQLNVPEYTKTVFSQFSDPRNQQVQGAKDQQLLQLLRNPESLSQTWQDQMFEQQKDDANSLAKQLGLQNQQGMASRGWNPFGNQAQWQQQELQDNLANQLLAGRRNVATQAATQNRADVLNALQAGEAGLSGDTSRAGSVFQNTLAGQQAQQGDNQFASTFGLQSQQAQAGNERDNYLAYLQGRNLQGSENRAAEQYRQSAFGLSNQSQQNARSSGLQEWLAQNNNDLGWANYGLSADGQFLNYLNGQG